MTIYPRGGPRFKHNTTYTCCHHRQSPQFDRKSSKGRKPLQELQRNNKKIIRNQPQPFICTTNNPYRSWDRPCNQRSQLTKTLCRHSGDTGVAPAVVETAAAPGILAPPHRAVMTCREMVVAEDTAEGRRWKDWEGDSSPAEDHYLLE